MSNLSGKRILITGASRGIGAAIAEACAAAGATLVISARDAEALRTQAAAWRERFGAEVTCLPADLARTDGPDRMAGQAWTVHDGLDALVNNAGVSYPEPIVELSADRLDDVLTVHQRAPALLAARVGTAMAQDGGGGSLVTVASAAVLRPVPEHYGYCIAKAGLVMATKTLALELGPYGVRANSVCPTVVLTEMGQQVWGEHPDKAEPMLARIPLRRFAVPTEVADTVVWLASDASASRCPSRPQAQRRPSAAGVGMCPTSPAT